MTTFTTAADPTGPGELELVDVVDELVDVVDELALPPELQAVATMAIAPTLLKRTARPRAIPILWPSAFPNVKGSRLMAIVLPSALEPVNR